MNYISWFMTIFTLVNVITMLLKDVKTVRVLEFLAYVQRHIESIKSNNHMLHIIKKILSAVRLEYPSHVRRHVENMNTC